MIVLVGFMGADRPGGCRPAADDTVPASSGPVRPQGVRQLYPQWYSVCATVAATALAAALALAEVVEPP